MAARNNRGFIDRMEVKPIRSGNRRMDAKTRSSLGTFYKAQQISTGVFDKNGQQILDLTKVNRILSSWYAAKAENKDEFTRSLNENTAQVLTELSAMEPQYWTKQEGMSRDNMIESLGNKMARIALTTADIIPTEFRLGDETYTIRTTTLSVKGPNPLIPSTDCETCLYENARNNIPVTSYWPEDVHKLIMKNFSQRAGITLVDLDAQGNVVAPGEGLPAIMSHGRVLYAYREGMVLQNLNNRKTINFFEDAEIPVSNKNEDSGS